MLRPCTSVSLLAIAFSMFAMVKQRAGGRGQAKQRLRPRYTWLYASAVTGTSSGRDRQFTTPMLNIDKAIVSKLAAVRGRGKHITFNASSYDPSDKRGHSASNDGGHSRKAKVAAGWLCDYPMCRQTLIRVQSAGLRKSTRRRDVASLQPRVEGASDGCLKPVG